MKEAAKKSLLEKLESNHLLYKVFDFSGRIIIVHEATGHSSRKFGELSIKTEQDESLAEETKTALFSLYIPLMSCSEGDLPQTPDDFFWMKNEDIETWTREARTMNPQLFGLLDLQEKRLDQFLSDSDRAKKKKRRTKSNAS